MYELTVAGQDFLILTTSAGANRVYRAGSNRFKRGTDDARVFDASGRSWIVEEDHLTAEFDRAVRLARVPAARAFWFGWFAQYPETLLFK